MLDSEKEYYQKYRKYYNKYQKVRRLKIKLNPICQHCAAKQPAIIKPVYEVHHIKPISTGKTDEEKYWLATDIDNLESLCKACHDYEHDKYIIPEEFW